jgi:MFS family permease
MWPSVMSILSKRAGTINQGAVQGVASSFSSLASIIGLTVGGLLYNLIGEITFLISAGVNIHSFYSIIPAIKIEIIDNSLPNDF